MSHGYSISYLDAFDTVCSFTAYAQNRADFDALAETVHQRLLDYHRLFDIYHEYEGMVNLCTVNRLAGQSAQPITPELLELLLFSQEMNRQTSGEVNAAMGAVLSLWHQARSAGLAAPNEAALPDAAALQAAAAHCRMEDVILDSNKNTVSFSDPLLRLDLGAVAKGWTAQRICEELELSGCKDYLLDLGGTVCARGLKPGRQPWQIIVNHAECILSLSECCVATSAADQRYYTVGGSSYGHIISPHTLFPPTAFFQVTVLSSDAGLADTLSTALFLLPFTEGKALAQRMGVDALWLFPDGRQEMTVGFAAYLT